jgi:hypothetical protein
VGGLGGREGDGVVQDQLMYAKVQQREGRRLTHLGGGVASVCVFWGGGFGGGDGWSKIAYVAH